MHVTSSPDGWPLRNGKPNKKIDVLRLVRSNESVREVFRKDVRSCHLGKSRRIGCAKGSPLFLLLHQNTPPEAKLIQTSALPLSHSLGRVFLCPSQEECFESTTYNNLQLHTYLISRPDLVIRSHLQFSRAAPPPFAPRWLAGCR